MHACPGHRYKVLCPDLQTQCPDPCTGTCTCINECSASACYTHAQLLGAWLDAVPHVLLPLMISRRRLLQLLTLPYCRTVRVIMPKRIGNLSLELFFVLCVSSLPFAPCAIGAENNHLLVQRVTGVPDDLLNSIENGNFYLNQLLNITVNINSATEILVGTLGAYYSIPRSIIDIIQPGPLPYGKQSVKRS